MTQSRWPQQGGEQVDLAVVGAGTMGAGIAQVAVAHGLDVALYDADPAALERGAARVRAGLERRVESGRLPAQERDAALARLHTASTLDDVAVVPFVIEAVPEDLELKRMIFGTLDRLCTPQAILATNTSSLSITKIAAAAARPERVAGMHFFNPVPALRLVEVIAGHRTSADTVERVAAIAQRLGKTPVRAKDTPGFIVNRVARHFYGEPLRILAEGVDVATIDRIVRVGGGFKMGPFALMDLIGIDVNFAVTRAIHDAFFGDPRYRPHPIQERMVDAGLLGRKAGRGFYEYGDGER
jgi:3-hydroxybutyryl-CoA dehydrogenase